MKAISLTQPWATLMAIGAKKIETRSWSTKHRGWLAIHASKGFPGWAKDECHEPPFRQCLAAAGYSSAVTLPLGAIIALGRMTLCLPTDHDTQDFIDFPNQDIVLPPPEPERSFGDYSYGRHGWVFPEVIRLPNPVPCKGALGLWQVPEDVDELVKAQYRAVAIPGRFGAAA